MGLRPDLEGQRIISYGSNAGEDEVWFVLNGVGRSIDLNRDNLQGRLFRDGDALDANDVGEFERGPPINDAFLISDRGDERIWLVDPGGYLTNVNGLNSGNPRKHYISSPATMDRYHFDWGRVITFQNSPQIMYKYLLPYLTITRLPLGNTLVT
jgi:hypothetical protein